VIFGDGTQTRDYVFVQDVARANLLASTVPLPPAASIDDSAFNIATSRQTSVLQLAETVGRVMGRTPELEFSAPRPGELLRSALDVSKARSVLGWTPEWSLDRGLPALVRWFEQEAT
jgi:UDP-glucose 4-epimerase